MPTDTDTIGLIVAAFAWTLIAFLGWCQRRGRL